MKRVGYSSLAACAWMLCAGAAFGQSATTFSLGFSGESSKAGGAGSAWSSAQTCTLESLGEGLGAQGWSISLGVENASITSITIAGTDAATLSNGGFDQTELTTGAGNEGAVSAVVLSFTKPITLPPPSTPASVSTIAVLNVEGTIPAGVGTAAVFYVDGRKGSGQPVPNNITQDSLTVAPTLGRKVIDLREIVSCCDDPINVGFSGGKVSSAVPFDGIANAEPLPVPVCSASGGEIVTVVDEGATGAAKAYANVVSNGAAPGVQGWSFSIALNGNADFDAAGVTTAGTPGYDENFDGGFEQTEVIDPAKNAGQRGAVSAVVLSFTKPRVLPATSTKSVLEFNLVANAAQGAADIVGSLLFQTRLRGSGQPVENAVTVNSETQKACNFETAGASIIFRLKPAPQNSAFTRGNPNDDSKLDIADPIWIINELFRDGQKTACQASADANDDNVLDSADAVYLIEYLFQGGPAPSAPFGTCAVDPTPGSDPAAECPSGSVGSCS